MTRAKRLTSLGRLIIVAVAFLSPLLYVAFSAQSDLWGYPLDDAWIHQTYARNLAETGQLAYIPGQPSAGSTSPAWSYLLSVGYLVGLDHRIWSVLLGALALAATALLVYRLALRLPPVFARNRKSAMMAAAIAGGLFAAVEWHLAWAAASGMETILFTALSLALLEYFYGQVSDRRSLQDPASVQAERHFVGALGIGLLGGVLVLVRPEGLGLFALILTALVLFPRPADRKQVQSRLLGVGVSLLGLGAVLVPYVLFNLETAGSIFPNTFYAKQAEYQVQISLPLRFWRVLGPTLVGAQVLLIPGFCLAVYRLVRERYWAELLPFVWWFLFLAAYALRLPVNYQHGRYTIPTIPILILYGIWGTAGLLRLRSPQLIVRVLSQATPIAIALLAVAFWVRGATAYREDTEFIERELVAVAAWLDGHTAPDALIAVHDIGAIGFFSDLPLLDLAGLISPDVIPFISDADQLFDWMLEQGASHAVFFPDFSETYVQLAADPRLDPVHCSDYAWTRQKGHENLCVYRISNGKQP